MVPAISWNTKVVIWIITGIATVVFGLFSVVLQSNLAYLFRRLIPAWRRVGGRKPTSKPSVVWCIYFISIIVMISGTAVASAWKEAPIPDPPLSKKLNFMTVVDASDRMLSSIDDGEQKWQVAVRSLQGKLSVLPSGANFGLVEFGQVNSANTLPCSDMAELLVPVDDLRTADGSSQQRTLSAIDEIAPGNKGSLNSALKLALEQLAALPQDYSKTLIIVTGGGDSCDSQAEWDILEFVLGGAIDDVNVYTELIVLVNEDVKAEVEMKVQKISRLDAVTVSLPASTEELDDDLESAIDRAIERGKTVDPAPFIVQETIVAATQLVATDQIKPTFVQLPQNTNTFIPPNPTIIPTLMYTPTLRPTNIPLTITFTFIPPTNIPTIILPTNTPKVIPPTATTTSVPPSSTPQLPNVLYITNPQGGANLSCEKNMDCIIPVTIQWISDTQATMQGLYLSIWVKPYPGNPSYLFSSQTVVSYLGNGSWQSSPVYIGKNDDDPGIPFAIYAIVTNQPYATNQHLSSLPPHTKGVSIQITR